MTPRAPEVTAAVVEESSRVAPAAAPKRARAAVLGASGYTGQEFVRLALTHPGLEIVALISREHAGRPAAEGLPGLDPRAIGRALPTFEEPAAIEPLIRSQEIDTLVSCLPHGAFTEWLAASPDLGPSVRIIDLSSDHRDESRGFRYGLPEAFRTSLVGAHRIANPGCYPTAAALALLPALERGWAAGPVMVSALSGVSGAGRSPALKTSFVELEGGASIYRAGVEHAHVGEMRRTFTRLAGRDRQVGFTPQLVPMARGILLTATAPLDPAVTADEIHEVYVARYAREPFVRVLDHGQWPETRAVRGSNRCDVAVTTLHDGRTLLATAAIDNLVKGAAGQAIQNLNLMLGWPEDQSLPLNGSPW